MRRNIRMNGSHRSGDCSDAGIHCGIAGCLTQAGELKYRFAYEVNCWAALPGFALGVMIRGHFCLAWQPLTHYLLQDLLGDTPAAPEWHGAQASLADHAADCLRVVADGLGELVRGKQAALPRSVKL